MDFVIDVMQSPEMGTQICVAFPDTKDAVRIFLHGVRKTNGIYTIYSWFDHNDWTFDSHSAEFESLQKFDVSFFCTNLLMSIVRRFCDSLRSLPAHVLIQKIQEHEQFPEMEKAVTEFIGRAPK